MVVRRRVPSPLIIDTSSFVTSLDSCDLLVGASQSLQSGSEDVRERLLQK